MVPAVPMTPIRPLDVAPTAARTPGSITPTTGTSKSCSSCGTASAEAVLHATTTILTPRPSRNRTFSREKRSTVSALLVP
jgi:hypothetical protein